METRRRFLVAATAAATAAAASRTLWAQPAPHLIKQVTVVVGYPPGGGTDVIARLVSEGLRNGYAESVVVENRAGAGGRIAAQYVKDRTPDGTVLLFTPAFPMIIYPHVYKAMRYDTLKDFEPVAMTHRGIMAFSVGPGVPAEVKTVGDFVTWAKAHPEESDFGATAGSAQHFAGVVLARATGIKLEMIDYKGGAPAITDCMGGHVKSVFTAISEVIPFMGDGKLRILATTGSSRSPAAPNVPTMIEAGVPQLVSQDWSGFLAPAKTPAAIIERANAAINATLVTDKVMTAMTQLGAQPAPISPAQFAIELKAGWEKYRELVKSTGFVAEE